MRSKIKCEHPVIIQNHKFREYYLKFRHFHTPFQDFILSDTSARQLASYVDKYMVQFSPRRMHVTLDNFDEFYFIDKDGCFYPAYLCVPCGKCELCKEKKSMEYVTRCAIETYYSKTIPLFITLTYANEPLVGLVKRDVQLFLKRLRIKLQRDFDWKLPLRYFLVGEYGKHHRAHYHMLLWNFPTSHFDLTTQKDSTLLPFTSLLNKTIFDLWTHGFVHIGIDTMDDKATNYCAKYMRKDCDYGYRFKSRLINGKLYKLKIKKSKTFMLCSRGSKKLGTQGLGSQYVEESAEYHRRHPEVNTIQLCNKFTGVVFDYPMPQYIREKIFPTISRLVPKVVRDRYRDMLLDLEKLVYFRRYKGVYYWDDLLSDYYKIANKFSFLDFSLVRELIDSPTYIADWFRKYYKRGLKDSDTYTTPKYREVLDSFEKSISYFDNLSVKYEQVNRFMKLKDIRLHHLQMVMFNLPELDISFELAKLRKRKARDVDKRLKNPF